MLHDNSLFRKTTICVFNPFYLYTSNEQLEILRIVLDEHATRLDCVFHSSNKPLGMRDVLILQKTFLRIYTKDTEPLKLELLNAVNIPIFPAYYRFKSTDERFHFSLYFPPMPEQPVMIDLIEKDSAGPCTNIMGLLLVSKQDVPKMSLN